MPLLGTLPRMSKPSTDVTGVTSINWLAGPIFINASLAVNTTYTFSNEAIGQEITMIIGNASASTIDLTFTPSTGSVQWERGEKLDQVAVGTYTVFKFIKINSSIIVGSIASNKVKTDLGYREIRNFYMTDPTDIGFDINRWIRLSGTGNMTYETSSDNSMGYGRYAFDGNCVYEFKDFIPVMPFTGVGGYGRYKKASLTANIYLGASCYDANKNNLSTLKYFITNGGAVSTSWVLSQGRAKMEGASIDNLATGTRFIRPVIAIANFTGTTSDKVYVSGFNIYNSNFATVADYA